MQNVLLAGFLVAVMVTDWRWTRIPNYLTYPGILVGLGLSALSGWGAPGVGGLLDHALAVHGSNKVAVEIINSPLSEYGVLGFELGYSLESP